MEKEGLQPKFDWDTLVMRGMMTGAAPKSVRLRFRNPRYERIVRVNTESIARKMGFTEDDIFDITLAVEEAYTNAIEHSGKARGDLELEIVYLLYVDRLEVSVQDSGQGFHQEPKPSGEADALPDMNSDRGRGLGLIRNLADRFEILSEPGSGTLIRIVKFLVPRQGG